MNNKLIKVGLITVFSTLMFGAAAIESPDIAEPLPFYLGVGAGIGSHQPPEGAALDDIILNFAPHADAMLGYRFSSNWGMEFNYTYFEPVEGSYEEDGEPVNAPDHFRTTMFDLSGIYTYHLSPKLALATQLGLANVYEDTYNDIGDNIILINQQVDRILPIIGEDFQIFWTPYFSNSIDLRYVPGDSKIKPFYLSDITFAYHF